MLIPDPRYTLNQRVYHSTPESTQGLVIDIRYSLRTRTWAYLVTFSPGNDFELYEDEISESKIF